MLYETSRVVNQYTTSMHYCRRNLCVCVRERKHRHMEEIVQCVLSDLRQLIHTLQHTYSDPLMNPARKQKHTQTLFNRFRFLSFSVLLYPPFTAHQFLLLKKKATHTYTAACSHNYSIGRPCGRSVMQAQIKGFSSHTHYSQNKNVCKMVRNSVFIQRLKRMDFSRGRRPHQHPFCQLRSGI